MRSHRLPDKGIGQGDAFDYIERFYNPFRKHSKLNCLNPVQFEERQRLKGLGKASGKLGKPQVVGGVG